MERVSAYSKVSQSVIIKGEDGLAGLLTQVQRSNICGTSWEYVRPVDRGAVDE
jgi:hypothetical protein